MQDGTLLAGVDLGSNSFRLEIGRHERGQVHRVEYLKETVRLGAGLDGARNLTPEAMQRGWDCLARFGERLAGFTPGQVRAVATQTLREARNRDDFLGRAQQALGFPIEVISGQEEARLIYQGVAHSLPQSDDRRLVVDIGGRSTELILGRQFESHVTESWRVGSVAWSLRFFPDGVLSTEAFARATVAAQALLDEAVDRFGPMHWDLAWGSSGTIGSVADVLAASGWDAITPDGLAWLQQQLVAARHIDRIRLDGLKDDRRPVLAGGLAVLRAVFDLLDIQRMQPAGGALRQGVVRDLIQREAGLVDLRSATVQRLAARFGVEAAQARRVDSVAVQLLRQLRAGRADAGSQSDAERKLGWAAQLHEIGCAIAHTDYHKHGAYILDNSDAAGFAQSELHRLGLLVLGHRGKLRKLEADFEDQGFVEKLLCLRLAVILCHARRDPVLGGLQLQRGPGERCVSVRMQTGWAERFPQSAHLLREEVLAWQKTPWSLQVA